MDRRPSLALIVERIAEQFPEVPRADIERMAGVTVLPLKPPRPRRKTVTRSDPPHPVTLSRLR